MQAIYHIFTGRITSEKQVNSMRTDVKYRLLLAFSIICVIGILAQAVYLWQFSERLARLEPDNADRERTIEERILANLNAAAPAATRQDPFTTWMIPPLDPFASLQQMQQRMDSLFGNFGSFGPGLSANSSRFSFGQLPSTAPAIEVHETDTEYEVVIAVAPDEELELNTNLEDKALSVSGRIKREASNQGNSFAATVVSQSAFSRTIDLPHPVDEFGLTTRQTDAGIVITIPKKTV